MLLALMIGALILELLMVVTQAWGEPTQHLHGNMGSFARSTVKSRCYMLSQQDGHRNVGEVLVMLCYTHLSRHYSARKYDGEVVQLHNITA
jgi:hypothetical protein